MNAPMQFDQFAGNYKQLLDENVSVSGENSAYFAEYKARYLARFLSRDFSGKVLDFGCGIGLLSGFLRKHLPTARLEGYDVSRDSIGKIDPVLAAQGKFTWEADRLARDYKLIVIANVMHHVPREKRQDTVQQLAGRLAASGRLAIFEHNPANPVTRWVVERCPFDEDAVLLPPPEASFYLASAKLRLVRRDYIVFMPRFLAWLRPLEPWIAWLPLGAQYVVIGEKHD